MRKIVYSVAMSLDGYIAGPNGEFDWIVMDPDIDFGELMGRFDTLLVGRRSWQAMQGQGGPGMGGVKTYVFSTTLSSKDCAGATLSESPAEVVAALKAGGGKDIWLFGGGDLFRSMLDAGLVDSIEIAVIPVLLGGGIAVLQPGDTRHSLNLVSQRLLEQTGTLMLSYAPA